MNNRDTFETRHKPILETIFSTLDSQGDQRIANLALEVKSGYENLLAENEQLRKDAERYRFLRDKANANKGNPFISILNNGVFSQWTGGNADEAIDKAMAETK